LNLLPIASSGGVTVHAPARGFVSFTNSPYYSHEHGLAVDIYPLATGATAFSPVQGDLVEVFTVRSPRPRYFEAAEEERLLIIRPVENPRLVVRILHTDYDPGPGANLSVGTPIGNIVRSGFYDFWTERHIHVEVRNATHLLRAKGSLPMVPLTQASNLSGTPSERPPKLTVVGASRNFTLVDPEEGVMSLGPLNGLGCRVGEAVGILDAGVPHYRVGSVHLEKGVDIPSGEYVELWGTPVGRVTECGKGLAIFKSLPMEVRLNGHAIRGLSLYPWIGRRPLLKLIPHRPTQPKWCKGEEVTVGMWRVSQ
jgi:hypothetical protein